MHSDQKAPWIVNKYPLERPGNATFNDSSNANFRWGAQTFHHHSQSNKHLLQIEKKPRKREKEKTKTMANDPPGFSFFLSFLFLLDVNANFILFKKRPHLGLSSDQPCNVKQTTSREANVFLKVASPLQNIHTVSFINEANLLSQPHTLWMFTFEGHERLMLRWNTDLPGEAVNYWSSRFISSQHEWWLSFCPPVSCSLICWSYFHLHSLPSAALMTWHLHWDH